MLIDEAVSYITFALDVVGATGYSVLIGTDDTKWPNISERCDHDPSFSQACFSCRVLYIRHDEQRERAEVVAATRKLIRAHINYSKL